MDNYRHFVRPTADNVIRQWYVDGITDNYQQGDILIDDNGPRQFNRVMTNEAGQFIYKIENNAIIFRTQAELNAEIAALPPEPPSLQEQMATMQQVINLLLEV